MYETAKIILLSHESGSIKERTQTINNHIFVGVCRKCPCINLATS